jgi:teichuronic acid biosynthesis glycosyltransferase TuaG
MISILMPIYNGIEYISESVNSILAQTFTEWELLIGVNGHPENSDVYKKSIEYTSDKISVRDFPDLKGKSVTLNKLITFSRYDTICLLDVDDIWKPEKLFTQVPYISKYDVIGTSCQYFGESDAIPRLYFGELSKSNFSELNTIVNSSCMINRRGRELFWDPEWDGVEDYDLWIRLVNNNWTFYNIDLRLVEHRIHNDSFFNTKNINLSETLRKKWYNV